ncbi:MAG: hypothetical protein JWN44_7045 [Myxococcales bacterium]|nr:hypothetical protein [Myxococcales bacterium]
MTAARAAHDDARAFLDGLLAGDDVRARVDWPRYRLMQLMQGTAGSDAEAREQLLARGFVELARGNFGADAAERALRSLRSLIEILLPRGWRFVDSYENPMVIGLRGGPTEGAPPNLRRYLTMLQEIAGAAAVVTIAAREDDEGRKLMTLLFVDGKYVGFLPGSMVARS